MFSGVMEAGREPTAARFLQQYNLYLQSKYLTLCAQKNVALLIPHSHLGDKLPFASLDP